MKRLPETTIPAGMFTLLLICSAFSQSSWTWRYPLPTGYSLSSAAWTGSQYVVVGDSGTILTSTDKEVWTRQSSGTTKYLASVIWADSLLVQSGRTE